MCLIICTDLSAWMGALNPDGDHTVAATAGFVHLQCEKSQGQHMMSVKYPDGYQTVTATAIICSMERVSVKA